MNKKKILVTGGLGYIGSHTVIALDEMGYETVIVDNLSNSSMKVYDIVTDIIGHDIPFYKMDIRDIEDMRTLFNQEDISVVINFAASKAVGESVSNPLKYYDNNIVGLITLLKVMEEHNVSKFVFSSSATVYGENEKMPLLEEYPLDSINPYGATKVFSEQILMDLVKSNPKWDVVALRYFNPLGAHESGRIGDNPNGIPNNLAPYVTQVMVGKLPQLTIYGDDYPTPDGTCIRDYIHISDLANGHYKAVKRLLENPNGYEAINLGSGQGYSVKEIVAAFEKTYGKTIPTVIGARRAGDGAISYADVTKAKELLDWNTEKTLQDMCDSAWNWQQKNPEGL